LGCGPFINSTYNHLPMRALLDNFPHQEQVRLSGRKDMTSDSGARFHKGTYRRHRWHRTKLRVCPFSVSAGPYRTICDRNPPFSPFNAFGLVKWASRMAIQFRSNTRILLWSHGRRTINFDIKNQLHAVAQYHLLLVANSFHF